MTESNDSDIDRAIDSPPEPPADSLPSDVMEIVASLEEEEATEVLTAERTVEVLEQADVGGIVAAEPSGAEAIAEVAPVRTRVPAWPFLMYFGIWLGFAGATAWLLMNTTSFQAVFSTQPYEAMIQAALVLTAVGPCLVLVVWVVLMFRAGRSSRAGLLSGSLIRGAFATLGGVLVWVASLILVDVLRLGRPL